MTLIKNPEVIVREEESDQYLVFNRENNLPLIMNQTSYRIWSLCDGALDLPAIVARISADCRLDESSHSIVESHLDTLRRLRLLLDADEPSMWN